MEFLVWLGALLAFLGLAGIIWSIVAVIRARRGLDETALKARMQKILPVNLGAFFLSVLGLMLVAAGVLLGG